MAQSKLIDDTHALATIATYLVLSQEPSQLHVELSPTAGVRMLLQVHKKYIKCFYKRWNDCMCFKL